MEFSENEVVGMGATEKVGSVLTRKESFRAVGSVCIRQFKMVDGEKQYFDDFKKNNLIVMQGREGLLDILSGAKKMHLKYIRYGQGGALKFPKGDPLDAIPVQDSDIDIGIFLKDKVLSTPKKLSRTELEYRETLICDEINDDVNEAAMMFEEDVTNKLMMFARITFPTVRLTVDKGTGIEIIWRFNFNQATEEPFPVGTVI
jgi:hypothetical protein